ncbi:MAG: hypothetical protein DRO40_00115 [Thermoprotei archaeon]|mgnify:CR=1 FL=1|nr:MAG: hypothetical protein DRO40_00115 [Thermoprotei archaeon]
MVKLITMNVRDLDNLINKIVNSGYKIEYGAHAVLPDNSEIEEIYVFKNERLLGIVIAHYISQYYKVIIENEEADDSTILKKLLEVKYSNNKWRTPVSPIAVLTDDDELVRIFEKYKDEYPCDEAKRLSNIYKEKTPINKNIISGLLARAIENSIPYKLVIHI